MTITVNLCWSPNVVHTVSFDRVVDCVCVLHMVSIRMLTHVVVSTLLILFKHPIQCMRRCAVHTFYHKYILGTILSPTSRVNIWLTPCQIRYVSFQLCWWVCCSELFSTIDLKNENEMRSKRGKKERVDGSGRRGYRKERGSSPSSVSASPLIYGNVWSRWSIIVRWTLTIKISQVLVAGGRGWRETGQ